MAVGCLGWGGPALDMYDVGKGQALRQLSPEGLAGNWWPTGAWSGDHFYLYAANDTGSGRLWNVSTETSELGTGVTVAPFGMVAGCSEQGSRAIVSAGGTLFLYEEFGFKLDRRSTKACPGSIPGGAWVIDPSTGQFIRQIAPELHFSALLADMSGLVLYGLSAAPNWERPAELVRIDPIDGRVLKTRYLDPGFWRIAIATLRVIRSGEVHVTP